MNLVINTYPVKLYPLILEEIIDLTVDIDDRLAENYGENLDFTDSIAVTTVGYDTFTDSTGETGVNDPAQTIDDRGISDKYKRFSNQ